jgi:hypothetical protein
MFALVSVSETIAAISTRDEVLCIFKGFISFTRATALAVVGFDFFGWGDFESLG